MPLRPVEGNSHWDSSPQLPAELLVKQWNYGNDRKENQSCLPVFKTLALSCLPGFLPVPMAPVNQPFSATPSVASLSTPLTSPAKSESLPFASPLSPASNPFPPLCGGCQISSSSGLDALFLANARVEDSLVTHSPVGMKASSLSASSGGLICLDVIAGSDLVGIDSVQFEAPPAKSTNVVKPLDLSWSRVVQEWAIQWSCWSFPRVTSVISGCVLLQSGLDIGCSYYVVGCCEWLELLLHDPLQLLIMLCICRLVPLVCYGSAAKIGFLKQECSGLRWWVPNCYLTAGYLLCLVEVLSYVAIFDADFLLLKWMVLCCLAIYSHYVGENLDYGLVVLPPLVAAVCLLKQ
ncbi:hypothetical protein Nepgr_013509 [Nepenthes gracilis]|uniref:Uncharacterized protein n=1 Tax=Nepenthes gracilis TaxID=150966 RepID=A0AAD3XP29_NEPGR|nr:hypothetical protein Nepgr_013509 [Nepenthes gracilis]